MEQFSTNDPLLAALIRNDQELAKDLLANGVPVSRSALNFSQLLRNDSVRRMVMGHVVKEDLDAVDEIYDNLAPQCLGGAPLLAESQFSEMPPMRREESETSLGADDAAHLEEVLAAIRKERGMSGDASAGGGQSSTGGVGPRSETYVEDTDDDDYDNPDDAFNEMVYLEELDRAARQRIESKYHLYGGIDGVRAASSLPDEKKAVGRPASSSWGDFQDSGSGSFGNIWGTEEKSDADPEPRRSAMSSEDPESLTGTWAGRGGAGPADSDILVGSDGRIPAMEGAQEAPRIQRSISLNEDDSRSLMHAIKTNDIERVRHLVEMAGYDVTAADVALAQANKCQRELIDLLVEYALG